MVLFGLAGLAHAEPSELPLEKRTYTDAKGKTLPYRLLKPLDYDPTQKYPLVLFLHGAGERGTDNEKQLIHGVPEFAKEENRKRYPCFLIAPQCPSKDMWVDLNWRAETHRQSEEPAEPMRLALELVGTIQKEFSIDARRIYVTGLSMGGYGTWDALARRPELFAAGVPICGGGDETTASAIAKIPVWVFHGAKDPAVKVERSRRMVEALKRVGGDPKYTEYPDEGHASWVPAYKSPELIEWLFDQKRAVSAGDPSSDPKKIKKPMGGRRRRR
jgi:predicted peptidase